MTWWNPRGWSRRVIICIAAAAVVVAGGTVVTLTVPQHSGATGLNYVTRSGDQLTLDGKAFRFAGTNIYWGGYDENARGGDNYPTPFRVQAALQTAQEMGETVVRCQTCGISTGSPLSVEPSLGTFSQTALQHIDYFVAQAADYGIRLVIPLTDNYNYYLGSYCNFTDWLNLTTTQNCPSAAAASAFYTNPRAIAAFEQYILTLLNHVNSYTGVPNKDNPTIMAWETGNELPYGTGGAAEYTQWTATITAYIKSVAPNQLVMDGSASLDPGDLKLGTVDIQDLHQYPIEVPALNAEATQVAAANQALVIGEYGWNNPATTNGLASFLADVYATKSISGDIYWDLLPPNDDFGYVTHYDGYQLHFPGDSTDVGATSAAPALAAQSDAPMVTELRSHGYQMSGLAVPAYPVPGVPVITNVEHVASQVAGTGNLLEWRGVPGAGSYVVSRSATGASGPWTTVGTVSAAATAEPYLDSGAAQGPTLWYQVTAVNPSGQAGAPSASFAYVDNTLDDNLADFADSASHTPAVSIDTTNPWRFGGDTGRAEFPPSPAVQSVTWHVPGMVTFEATACYASADTTHFAFQVSADDATWTGPVADDVQANQLAGASAGDWLCYIYTIDNVQGILNGADYIQVYRAANALETAELGEVRVTYP
jgi:hypothetical protein